MPANIYAWVVQSYSTAEPPISSACRSVQVATLRNSTSLACVLFALIPGRRDQGSADLQILTTRGTCAVRERINQLVVHVLRERINELPPTCVLLFGAFYFLFCFTSGFLGGGVGLFLPEKSKCVFSLSGRPMYVTSRSLVLFGVDLLTHRIERHL